jgi:hypothetical protein
MERESGTIFRKMEGEGSMSNPLIIGFGSKARQGKDTAAEAIVNYYDMERGQQRRLGLEVSVPFAVRIGFADALYDVARTEYGMKEKDAPLLQRIGAERRVDDSEYWIKRAFAKIKPYHDIVVIPDVRYKNEAVYVKNMGGYLVNVTRLNGDGTPFVDPGRPADHPSEIDLDNWNWDFKFVISDGHAALTGELAVTLSEYLRKTHQ